VRLVVFGAVRFYATRRNPKVIIPVKWAMPLVAFVFALLNTTLYWVLRPVLDLATFGALAFFMPLIINTLLLFGTVKFFTWHKLPRFVPKASEGDKKSKDGGEAKPLFAIHGLFATLWLALILTVAHGALWVALDYLPAK
jgi:hypothetical protein